MKVNFFEKKLAAGFFCCFSLFCLASLAFPSPLLAKKSDQEKTPGKSSVSQPAEESVSGSSAGGDLLDMASNKTVPQLASPKIISVAPLKTFGKPQAAAGAQKTSGQLPPTSWNPNPPGAFNSVRMNPGNPLTPVTKESAPSPAPENASQEIRETEEAPGDSDELSGYEEESDETLEYMEEETEESRAESN